MRHLELFWSFLLYNNFDLGGISMENQVVKATITDIVGYGAFCTVEYNEKMYKGLIHISEIADEFVKNINDYVKSGDEVEAIVIGIDESKQQLKLSLKRLKK
jgi:predicted RNA-binding protein with RPS1 domain